MALTVLHHAEGNAVALLDDRVLLFSRSGRLTAAALAAVEELASSHVRRATEARPVGALAIVPANAGLSDNLLLDRQRALLRSLRSAPHVSFAFCVVGDGVHAMVMRAVVRVFVLGSADMRLFTDPPSAASWLGSRVGIDASAVLRALDGLPR